MITRIFYAYNKNIIALREIKVKKYIAFLFFWVYNEK